MTSAISQGSLRQTNQQLTQDFVSKSPSPNVESSTDMVFSISVNPIPQPKSGLAHQVVPLNDEDLTHLSVEQRRQLAEQRRQNMIKYSQINHLQQVKANFEAHQKQTDELIQSQKLQNSQVHGRSYFAAQRAKQQQNAQLEQRRQLNVQQYREKQQQYDDLAIKQIIELKAQKAAQKIAKNLSTQPVGATASAQRLTMRQKQILNQRADVSERRQKNIVQKITLQKSETLAHIKNYKLQKEAELQEIQHKIEEEKQNPRARRPKLLSGAQRVNFNYVVTQKQNQLLKQQALELKQKYSQMEAESHQSKKDRKYHMVQRHKQRMDRQQQHRLEYLQQQQNDAALDSIRFQNNIQRQKVTDQQLKEHLEKISALRATALTNKAAALDGLAPPPEPPMKQSISMSFYSSKKNLEPVQQVECCQKSKVVVYVEDNEPDRPLQYTRTKYLAKDARIADLKTESMSNYHVSLDTQSSTQVFQLQAYYPSVIKEESMQHIEESSSFAD